MDVGAELYERVSRLQWLLHRSHQLAHARFGPLADSRHGQGRVLALLRLQDAISTRDMAQILGIRQQSLNELLAKLERSGHITREPSPQDRRVMLVRASEAGLAAAEPPDRDVFDCLDDTEQAILLGYLDRVIEGLEDELPDEHPAQEWMDEARSRLGVERFELLMAAHGHRRRRRHGPHHPGQCQCRQDGGGQCGCGGRHGGGEPGECRHPGEHHPGRGGGEPGECRHPGEHHPGPGHRGWRRRGGPDEPEA